MVTRVYLAGPAIATPSGWNECSQRHATSHDNGSLPQRQPETYGAHRATGKRVPV